MEQIPSGYDRFLSRFGHEIFFRIMAACRNLSAAETKGDLGILIADEIRSFSSFDLQVICGKLRYEVDQLPSPYREAVRSFFIEQVFGPHHRIMAMIRSGDFIGMKDPIRDLALFRQYLKMVPEGCFSRDIDREYMPQFSSPCHSLFYYLMAGFSIFVLDQPGHPVGMPFPGGFRVEEKNGEFFCPVREKEKDVPHSICNFCPAAQDPRV